MILTDYAQNLTEHCCEDHQRYSGFWSGSYLVLAPPQSLLISIIIICQNCDRAISYSAYKRMQTWEPEKAQYIEPPSEPNCLEPQLRTFIEHFDITHRAGTSSQRSCAMQTSTTFPIMKIPAGIREKPDRPLKSKGFHICNGRRTNLSHSTGRDSPKLLQCYSGHEWFNNKYDFLFINVAECKSQLPTLRITWTHTHAEQNRVWLYLHNL